MHIVSIESLQEINTKTKEIKELKDIYERQNQILEEVLHHAETQECKEATMISDYEYSYFNINFEEMV